MVSKNVLAVLAGALLAVGCGGDEEYGPGNPKPPAEPWVNQKPLLQIASPSELAVGDVMTVLGSRFIEPTRGKIYLEFKGTYFDSKGGTNPVDLQVTPRVNTNDKGLVKSLTWEMWPNIVFSANGDQLGRFVGHVAAVNAGNDGSNEYSDPLPIKIDIKPSLIARMVRPLGQSCGGLVRDTLENLGMAFTVEAVGLRAGTKDNPLTFYWSFLAEQWKVAFNYGTLDPSAVAPQSGAFMLEDAVTSGTVSVVQDGGSRNFLLKVGSDLLGDARLKELKTGAINPADANNMPISVNVAAVDASGKSAKLAIKLIIHRKADMIYNGESRVAERFPAKRVSDCIPGGQFGIDVSYYEGQSESQSRSLGFSWNANLGVSNSPFAPGNPWLLGINFSAGFGMNVNEQVSSDQSKSIHISGHIMPGTYGAFYRQTTKVLRIAKLVGYNECGQSFALGEAILTDWLFTPELATGSKCPPPSRLPPAEKFE
jgi:hypothetical protein